MTGGRLELQIDTEVWSNESCEECGGVLYRSEQEAIVRFFTCVVCRVVFIRPKDALSPRLPSEDREDTPRIVSLLDPDRKEAEK